MYGEAVCIYILNKNSGRFSSLSIFFFLRSVHIHSLFSLFPVETEIFGAILKDLKILSFTEKEYELFFFLSFFFDLFLYKTNFTHGFMKIAARM